MSPRTNEDLAARRATAIKCCIALTSDSFDVACDVLRALKLPPFTKLPDESVGAWRERLIAHARNRAAEWLGHNIALR